MLLMTPNPITERTSSGQERSLLRFVASAARPVKKGTPAPTALEAFKTLKEVHRRYAKQWWVIWIVCMDGYADITLASSEEKAVHDIEAHGGAAGIVGLANIARSFTFLKKPLRADKRVGALLDRSGNAAADRFLKLLEPMLAEAKFLREQMEDPKKHS
jgi:hypothetical protein